MPQQKRPLLYIREFLNKAGHGSVALVYAVESKDNQGGSLTIGDCGRQITLELNMWNASMRENTLYKINTLYDVVRQLRQAMHRQARQHARSPSDDE